MTLQELSREYQKELAPMQKRLHELRQQRKNCPPEQRIMLEYRIRRLGEVYRQTREVSELLEHYYERGFFRNGKYTL